MAVFTPKKGEKKKRWHGVPPSRHLRRFLRKPLNRCRQAITVLHFPPVYFYLQQLIQLFPVVTYLGSACFRAISIQRVYKVTALMGFRKEVVFLRARVGGGSEASCLSSFNWFSVAIGASAFFSPSPPMKVQHFRANCLDSHLLGGVRGVVQDFTLIIVYIKWRAAQFRGNVWFRRSLSQREGFLSTQDSVDSEDLQICIET